MEKVIPLLLKEVKDSQIRSSLYVNRDLDRRASIYCVLGKGYKFLLTRDLTTGKDIVSGGSED